MAIRVSLVVVADTETPEDLGRVTNALVAAQEFKEAGDEVVLVFDGAGTKWPSVLSSPEHMGHPLYEAISDRIVGACDYCAGAFGATDGLRATGIPLVDEYHHHPSFRRMIEGGYQVITF